MRGNYLVVFKTREFARFAHRQAIHDSALRDAASRAGRNLVDADLGSGLIKQRVARTGQGRRGGYRVLMAFRADNRAVFLYGFAKNERDNIAREELVFWRRVAGAFIIMDAASFRAMMVAGEIIEVESNG